VEEMFSIKPKLPPNRTWKTSRSFWKRSKFETRGFRFPKETKRDLETNLIEKGVWNRNWWKVFPTKVEIGNTT
jgi:hypothetical protein